MNSQSLRPALLTALLVAATALTGCWGQSISASIAKPSVGYVRVNEPVVLNFSEKIDAKSVKLAVSPTTDFTVEVKDKKVMLTPSTGWRPAQTYALSVKSASNVDHSLSLSNWTGKFKTQPRVGIAGYLVDGKAVTSATGTPSMSPLSKVTITFTAPMRIASALPTLNGSPLLDAQYRWAADGKSVDIATSGYIPYQTYKIGITAGAMTAKGDVATDVKELSAAVTGIEPSNSTSQIPASFQTKPAALIVIDNAGLARPQYGLQTADMVFEYISEYSISRFTLVYFNGYPASIGPVRSCRMINTYLIEAFQGVQACSGASDGTLGYLWGSAGPGLPALRVAINDYDHGNHFLRVNWKPAPHNVFMDQGMVQKLIAEATVPGGPYTVDVGHPDSGAGTASAAPAIPLHGVGYSYDGGCLCYRPFDQGSPRVDAQNGGAQLSVKNVVVMHVPYRGAGWVEDVNGGAQSIWYDMNGSGPAEVWSDGKVVHATWHQGAAGQSYYQNTTQPVVFTDEAGNLLRLNTGLTWVHVVGNGQAS
ncbi:MAG TPA: DUF3048 domain-containing protein [Candidatus Dormibacteraeota bacterium]